MKDYLEIYEKFKDVKDIADLVEDTEKLRYYYRTRQFQEMLKHIDSLTKKYFIDTVIWNSVNRSKPITYEQAYISAENFLCVQGAKLIVEKSKDYSKHLTIEEMHFIEKIIR